VVSLANTGEVLRLVNRSGNRPSHEGAAAQFDQSISLCRKAGFRKILLRGDTDFSQTAHLDRWHDDGVTFCFGLDVTPRRHMQAEQLPESAWKPLKRPPKYQVKTRPRRRRKRVKQQVVEERGFKDIRLVDEEVAEMRYRPLACRRDYRLVIVRKNLEVSEPRQQRLFDDYRYHFYLTNDWDSPVEAIVFRANDRCQQENVLAQLGACRALHAPVDNLLSNNAYMLITSLAWNLKAWLALSLAGTFDPEPDNRSEPKRRLLTMEFRSSTRSCACRLRSCGRGAGWLCVSWAGTNGKPCSCDWPCDFADRCVVDNRPPGVVRPTLGRVHRYGSLAAPVRRWRPTRNGNPRHETDHTATRIHAIHVVTRHRSAPITIRRSTTTTKPRTLV
jgi:hypothetical protein